MRFSRKGELALVVRSTSRRPGSNPEAFAFFPSLFFLLLLLYLHKKESCNKSNTVLPNISAYVLSPFSAYVLSPPAVGPMLPPLN